MGELWPIGYYFIEALASFGIALNVVLYSLHLTAIIYSKIFVNKKPSENISGKYQGVSILKPLKGADPNLEENLETFFELDYPLFEILFCIQDDDDPAIDICQRLIKKYPNVPARVVLGGIKVGCNPKINNLMAGYNIMQYNYFWICDAGIRVLPLTLKDLVSNMTDKVAVVHAIPFTSKQKGFSTTVEKIYFGTQHSRVYISAQLVGVICMTGMSHLIRKDIIEETMGGLGTLSHYIAEDYFLAKNLADHGWKCRLASFPALQNTGNHSLRGFINRMARWTKLRISMVPFAVVFEPFSECFLSGILLSLSLSHFLNWNILVVLLYHTLAWFLLDYLLVRILENGQLHIAKCDFLVAWLVRETLTPYVLFLACWDPTINWRTGKFRIKCGGKAEEISSPHSLPTQNV